MSSHETSTASKRREDPNQLDVSRAARAYQREWFARLRREVFDEGKPYAIGGPTVPHEIWEALDLPFITDVWYSGLVAAKQQGAYYSKYLAQQGFHEGLSRYGALTLAVIMDDDNPDKPWGGLPKPALVCANSEDRSAQLLAKTAGAAYVPLETPSLRVLHPNWWSMSRWQWEDLDEPFRIDVMVEQLKELIAVSERIAGRKLDYERLAEIVDRVNRQEEYFDEIRTIITRAPKLPVRIGEVMSQVMRIQWHRGTEWALDAARAFRDEVKQRADAARWVCENERYRLMYVGQGLWSNLDFFTEFEQRYGAVFVRSNYLSIASDGYLRYGSDPLRALASRYVTMSEQMHIPGLGSAWASHEAREHRIDGGLSNAGWWGGRMTTVALEEAGIPILEFPVDVMGEGGANDRRMREMVAQFIETRLAPVRSAR